MKKTWNFPKNALLGAFDFYKMILQLFTQQFCLYVVFSDSLISIMRLASLYHVK